jgi:hypothetical protein
MMMESNNYWQLIPLIPPQITPENRNGGDSARSRAMIKRERNNRRKHRNNSKDNQTPAIQRSRRKTQTTPLVKKQKKEIID